MKIKIRDYGGKKPERAHYNDAGADVFISENVTISPGSTKKVPLGFGLELPDGFAAYIVPRSGMSSKGLTTELAPIDSGYTGEIHAIITLNNNNDFKKNNDESVTFKKGTKIAQLVIHPVVLCTFEKELGNERGERGFGSTGI